MAQDSVQINIDVATKAAEIALSRLKKQTEENTSAFNVFKGAFAANLATGALTKAFDFIRSTFGTFIQEASQAEQSIKNMEVALESAGLLTPEVSKEFQALGDSIEQTTKFSGDMVESSVALFASLTNLSADGITQATKAAVDLAATLNVDLSTATDMIAKAINGNVTGFNKLGISINKGNTDSERLANTLAALSSQQGAAASQAQTYAGASEIAANAQGKLFEAIGKVVTQNPVVIKGLQATADVFISLANYIEKNSADIILFAQSILSAAAIAATAFVTMKVAALGLSATFAILSTAASAAWIAITGPVALVVAGIALVGGAIFGVIKYWDQLRAVTNDVMAEILELSSVAAGIFNQDLAAKIQAQSDAYRNEATAIRETIAAKEANAAANSQEAKDAEALRIQQEENAARIKARNAEELADVRRTAQEKLNIARKYKDDLFLTEEARLLSLQELEAQNETNLMAIRGESQAVVLEAEIAQQSEALARRQAHEQAMLQASVDAELAKANLIKDGAERNKAVTEVNNKASLEKAKLQSKQEIETKKQQFKAQEDVEKLTIANRKDTFNTIATLANSSNKELAAIGKAAAISNATIDGFAAVQKALASAPPPFNFALAALVGTATAANVASIAGVNFATGGIVPGTAYRGDQVRANLNSREMVLNMGQQKQLFDIANGTKDSPQSNSKTNALITELILVLKNQPITVEVDGKQIFSAVRNELASGRGF